MHVPSEVIMLPMPDRATASGCSRKDQQQCTSHLAARSKQGTRCFHGGILITIAPDLDGSFRTGETISPCGARSPLLPIDRMASHQRASVRMTSHPSPYFYLLLSIIPKD